MSLAANSLTSRGIRVTNLKLDPYINVDPVLTSPSTRAPSNHEDGAETDLDLGHYERFTYVKMEAQKFHDRRDLRRASFRSSAAITWAAPCRSFRSTPVATYRPPSE